jgi:rhodanese-related sulfurtransferase
MNYIYSKLFVQKYYIYYKTIPFFLGEKTKSMISDTLKSTKKEILIDVRTRDEFRKRKIYNQSINIPVDELEENIEFLKDFENIQLVCLTGTRAAKAQEILEDNDIWSAEVLLK